MKLPSFFHGPQFQPRQEDSVPMPFIGFRQWSMVSGFRDGENFGAYLRPVVYTFNGYEWDLTTVNHAICLERGTNAICRRFREATCSCGLYLYKSPAFSVVRIGWVPMGIVVGWGEVLEHSIGFRVTKAKVLALLDHDGEFRAMVKRMMGNVNFPVPIFDLSEIHQAIMFAKQHGDLMR